MKRAVAAQRKAEASERFWELLGERERRVVEAVGRRLAHPAGTVLLSEGAKAESVLVLLSGRVKVIALGMSGHQTLLAIRVPGDVLGEMAAVDERRRSASVLAVEPIEVLRIPAVAFVETLRTEPTITYALLRVVSTKLRMANERRVQTGDTTVGERVATTLAELAVDHGLLKANEITITLPITQDELAHMVGGSREAVARYLRALREEGLIRTERQRITLVRPDLLGLRVQPPPRDDGVTVT
jgi:CRP/FNR family cyclic AMP-dependent transcriptional regulator